MYPNVARPRRLPGGVSQRAGARRAVRQAAVRRVRGQALRGAGPRPGAGLLQDDARGGVAVGEEGAGPQHRAQAAHAPRQSLFQKYCFASVQIFLCPGCTGGVARWSGGAGARHAGVGGGVRGVGRGRALPDRGAAAGQAQHRAEVPGVQRQQGEVLATAF